jgi:hypothetical protein
MTQETKDFLLKSEDGSITDRETIRQIAIEMRTGLNFSSKIKSGYEWAGLYPDVHFEGVLWKNDEVKPIYKSAKYNRLKIKQQINEDYGKF